jgi:EmrB/QacA subfamily drug resistance transporter
MSSTVSEATPAPPVPAPLVTDHRRRLVVFGVLMLTMFMAALDTNIVSTALPTIVGEFGELERFGWIGSAYLLALSAVMPVYGKLGDLFGRKYVVMAAIVIFVVGSVACGLAVSIETLIAARVLQGFGGGGLMVSIFAINADLFEPRERAKYQSYTSLNLLVASAIGPMLGGVMSSAFGWRSIFLINVPIGIAALVGLLTLLPYRRPTRVPSIDYPGAILLACVTTSIVLWADSFELFGSLVSPISLGVLALGAVAAVIWIFVERRAPEPIVPLGMFRNPTVSLLLIFSILSGAVAIGLVNYFALFLQATTGLSPAVAGLLFLFMTGGIATGSITTGRILSRGGLYKHLAMASAALTLTALLSFAFFGASVPLPVVCFMLLAHGFGIGLAQQVPIVGVQNAAARGDVGAATGTVALTRMAGASVAISVYGAVLAAHVKDVRLPGVGDLAEVTPAVLATLPPDAQAAIAATYAGAFNTLFLAAASCSVIAFVIAAMLRPIRLPTATR